MFSTTDRNRRRPTGLPGASNGQDGTDVRVARSTSLSAGSSLASSLPGIGWAGWMRGNGLWPEPWPTESSRHRSLGRNDQSRCHRESQMCRCDSRSRGCPGHPRHHGPSPTERCSVPPFPPRGERGSPAGSPRKPPGTRFRRPIRSGWRCGVSSQVRPAPIPTTDSWVSRDSSTTARGTA